MNITNASRNSSLDTPQKYLDFFAEPFGLMVFRLTIEVVIFAVGVLGNVLVCVVVFKERLYKAIAYVFVLNLAIADLGVLIFSVPFGLVRTEAISWPFGWFGCKVLYPFSDIFHGVSIASITAIAVYRYRGIVTGRSPDPHRTRKHAKLVVALVWVVSFLLLVLPLFFSMRYEKFNGDFYCFPKFSKFLYFRLYQAELLLLTYIIPLCIILFTYIKIRARLQESIQLRLQIRQQSGFRRNDHFNEKNFKALKILTPIVVVFALTMLPYNIYRFADIFFDTSSFRYMLLFFKFCVVAFICNSSANPVIYTLISDEFRKAFKWHLRHCSASPSFEHNKFFSVSERFTSMKMSFLHSNNINGREGRKRGSSTIL